MATPTLDLSAVRTFDRHIKRLVWCALIGSLALLIPVANTSAHVDAGLIGALGALVVVIAGLTVVKDVSQYVRREAARRTEAATSWRQVGACLAAEAMQDRLGNLLAVTVGHVDFLTEEEDLPENGREHANQALESALAAARFVSSFRQSLGCGPSATRGLRLEDPRVERRAASKQPPVATQRWHYDHRTRTVRDQQGEAVTSLDPTEDPGTSLRTGRLIAESPILLELLNDVQQVAAVLLAEAVSGDPEESQLRALLERINAVAERVDL